MMGNKRKKGFEYEKKACNFLIKQGLSVIERNFYSKVGEVDIIAKDKETIVFVEVKYRKNDDFGRPEESVNKKKIKKIKDTAFIYLQINNLYKSDIRFDVVSILGEEITWLRAAF